jgi:hypothetical protein
LGIKRNYLITKKKINMKNSFKMGALALVIAVSFAACKGKGASAGADSAKADSAKMDSAKMTDTTKKMVDTTKKADTSKKAVDTAKMKKM